MSAPEKTKGKPGPKPKATPPLKKNQRSEAAVARKRASRSARVKAVRQIATREAEDKAAVEGLRAERKTFSDETVRQQFLMAFRLGVPIDFACALVRVSTRTVYEVRDRGIAQKDGPDKAFALAFNAIPAQRTVQLLTPIHAAAKTDWKAARYLLACMYPEQFSEGVIERNADIERQIMKQQAALETDPEVVASEKRRRKAAADLAESQAIAAMALAKAAKEGKIGAVVGLLGVLNDPTVPEEGKAALRLWMDQNKVAAITTRNLGE